MIPVQWIGLPKLASSFEDLAGLLAASVIASTCNFHREIYWDTTNNDCTCIKWSKFRSPCVGNAIGFRDVPLPFTKNDVDEFLSVKENKNFNKYYRWVSCTGVDNWLLLLLIYLKMKGDMCENHVKRDTRIVLHRIHSRSDFVLDIDVTVILYAYQNRFSHKSVIVTMRNISRKARPPHMWFSDSISLPKVTWHFIAPIYYWEAHNNEYIAREHWYAAGKIAPATTKRRNSE